MTRNKYKVLVIEDESSIHGLIKTILSSGGYQVISAYTCSNGLMLYTSHQPDLVILDLGLPDLDGTDFLRRVREDSLTPVIILSARAGESDKVNALDMGANDYITKPFGANEFLARVRSALRFSPKCINSCKTPKQRFECNGMVIDYAARQVFINLNEIKLTQTEYNIIALLSRNAGRILTYSGIIKEIWGYNDINSVKKLQVNMVNIRKKFGSEPNNYIVNEPGVGYRMFAGDLEGET
ncbi:MAG: response regulator transcription factor [Clostridiales bacterium]|nr:response regulator transcription factor [Clostridiales bacterium]